MIGVPLDDAKLRLECWRLGVQMAGTEAYRVATVDEMATAAYTFIATEAVSPAASVPESRDKSTKTPKR